MRIFKICLICLIFSACAEKTHESVLFSISYNCGVFTPVYYPSANDADKYVTLNYDNKSFFLGHVKTLKSPKRTRIRFQSEENKKIIFMYDVEHKDSIDTDNSYLITGQRHNCTHMRKEYLKLFVE